MSRLTFRDSKGELWIKDAADIDEQGQICMLTDRLAAYEDIGLEPEEIKDHEEMFAAHRHVCGGKSPEEIVHALELMEAERNGRLEVCFMSNETKKAIEHFHYGITHDIFSEPVTTYARLAVDALREQAERNRGCEWCGDNREHRYKTMYRRGSDWRYEAKYCDMCGKRLEVEP